MSDRTSRRLHGAQPSPPRVMEFRMSAAPCFDVDALLAPIPGENPAGGPLAFSIRNQLDDLRKEIDPNDFAATDPMRPAEPKFANWPRIRDLAIETLTEHTKDLIVASRLVEAVTKLHGFPGLLDGLRLMRGLCEQCWDRCYPDIADGDLEVRAGPFNWLSDGGRGARLPGAINAIPLVTGPERAFGWHAWKNPPKGKEAETKEEFDKAVLATTPETCRANVETLANIIAEFTALNAVLAAKLGAESPGMSDLRGAVAECYALAKVIAEKKGPVAAATTAGETGGTPASPDGSGVAAPAGDRNAILQQLGILASRLESLEPNSPIPYIIRKAITFGRMTFPEMMKELIDQDDVIRKMNRELGIPMPTES